MLQRKGRSSHGRCVEARIRQGDLDLVNAAGAGKSGNGVCNRLDVEGACVGEPWSGQVYASQVEHVDDREHRSGNEACRPLDERGATLVAPDGRAGDCIKVLAQMTVVARKVQFLEIPSSYSRGGYGTTTASVGGAVHSSLACRRYW